MGDLVGCVCFGFVFYFIWLLVYCCGFGGLRGCVLLWWCLGFGVVGSIVGSVTSVDICVLLCGLNRYYALFSGCSCVCCFWVVSCLWFLSDFG